MQGLFDANDLRRITPRARTLDFETVFIYFFAGLMIFDTPKSPLRYLP